MLLTNVVGRVFPFHPITELDTKLEPVTLNVNPAPPTTTVAGDTEDNCGKGLSISKAMAFEAGPWPGFATVT